MKLNDRIYIYPELFEFTEVLEFGAKKYAEGNWLKVDGKKSSFKEMHDSMFHHLAQSFAGNRIDESGLDHLLHLQCRAGMMYTLLKRKIMHDKDSI